MAEKEAFLTKPKHQCHVSQLGEWVYGSQSWKEKILLCESVFVLNWQIKFDSKKS